MAAEGGGGRWQDGAEPELRPRVLQKLGARMSELSRALQTDKSPPEDITNELVASFEEHTFEAAKDKMDYMRKISERVIMWEKKVQQQAAADHQQQVHMVHPMQLPDMVQAIQGANNYQFTTTPQEVLMRDAPSWPPSQLPNHHTSCSFVSNMQSNVDQGPSDMMVMLYQNFNSDPAVVAPSVQSSHQQIIQSIAMRTENQIQAMQLQPIHIAQCHPASMVQLQGQQIARSNGYQNHLLGQNVWDYVQHPQPTIPQEHFGITQQEVGVHMQRYQLLGANVSKKNTYYSGGWNNQQNAVLASGIQSPSKACGLVAVKRQANMDSQPISPAQITANQQNNQKARSNQLQGVTSPYFSYKSPETLQSSLTNVVELCCTPSPIAKFGAASPSALLKSTTQSSIAKQGVVAAASPCVSAKSALRLAEKTGFEAAASPSELVNPASPSAISKSGIAPAALPSDSNPHFLPHDNEAVGYCNQATETKLLTPAPPAGQSEDQENGTPVAKKPVDHPVAAIRSSSPAALRSAANLMESALIAMDSIPLRTGSGNGIKRVYDVTSLSESPTLSSTDDSSVTSDASDSTSSRYRCGKRQKTQFNSPLRNAKAALFHEVQAVNSRLIDTLISITSCNGRTLIKLSYTAVSLAPDFRSHFTLSGNFQHPVMPTTLLIPADYPRSSPVVFDDERDAQTSRKLSSISVAVNRAFGVALCNLEEPRSLKEIARVWDNCVRRALKDYAYQLCGPSSLSLFDGWVKVSELETVCLEQPNRSILWSVPRKYLD